MRTTNTYKILVWIIVILLATNLSMGISFVYHKIQDKKMTEQAEENLIEVPSEQRTRFFREQLNLAPEQVNLFRDYNRNYNRTARDITIRLENLRMEMVTEMGKPEPDLQKLDTISKEFGELHTELKNITIDYYMKMKAECNEEQKARLNEIFMSMLKKNENLNLPEGNGRRGRGFRNNN